MILLVEYIVWKYYSRLLEIVHVLIFDSIEIL